MDIERPAKLFRESFTPIPGHETPVGREDERFREHFEEWPGVIKQGPWYALARWFQNQLPILGEEDFIFLDYRGSILRMADLEVERRLPYMVQRNPDADPAIRRAAAIQGFRTEKHIGWWFREGYPQMYRPPPNEDDVRRPSPVDFRLAIWYNHETVQMVGIDIARANSLYPLRFCLHPNKMRGADLVLVGYDNEYGIMMCGYTKEPKYGEECGLLDLQPMERLIVALNISRRVMSNEEEVDYYKFKRKAEGVSAHGVGETQGKSTSHCVCETHKQSASQR